MPKVPQFAGGETAKEWKGGVDNYITMLIESHRLSNSHRVP